MHAHHHTGATCPSDVECLGSRCRHTYGLKGIFNPLAISERHDGFIQVVRLGINCVGGAKLTGHFQLGVNNVNGNDLGSPGNSASLYDIQANAAAANDRNISATRNASCVKRSANTCHHPAANEGRFRHGHFLGDFHQAIFRSDHHFRKGTH